MDKLKTNNYSATVDITTKCNLRCKHCRLETTNYDLSLEQIEIIASKLANKDRRIVFISGGEPLVRNDIVEVVKIFKKYISCVCINTNSLLLTEELLDNLIEAGLNYIQVSLDGVKDTHDYMRGEGTYEKTMDKLKMISKKSIKLHISCCISSLNIDKMEDFADTLQNDSFLKIDLLGFKRFIPKNEMAGVYNLNKDGLKELYDKFETLRNKYDNVVIDFPQKNIFCEDKVLSVMKKYSLSCAGCSAATGGPCIRSNGSVSPCSLLYLDCGNIFEMELDEIYNSKVFINLCQRNLKGGCGSCKYKYICGGCRAAAYALTGDYLEKDPECFYV